MAIDVGPRFPIWSEAPDEPRGHLCEPRLTKLRNGDLVLSFRTGSLRYSPDGSPRILRSADGGATWTDLGRPLDDLLPGRPGWDYRALALTELLDGRLLAVSVGLDRVSHGREPWLVYNPDPQFYQGMIPIRNQVTTSADGGRTWARPHLLEGLTIRNSSAQCLVTVADGTVMTPVETFKDFEERGPWRYRVDMIRSHDGGASWGETAAAHVSDPDTDPDNLMCWDPRLSRLADGRLVQTYYAFLNGTGGEGPIHINWSTDDGRTWSVPRSTGIRGQAMFPIPMPGGDLIGFFQRRRAPQGVVAIHSTDGGATFDEASEVPVYLHATPSGEGFREGGDAAAYMNDMIHFTFGHPTGAAIGPREAIAIWYAGDKTRTTIWGAILRVS